jgi:CTP synthase
VIPIPVAESGAPPGLRHAGLSLLAEALGARELRADGRARSDDDVHAVQHVTADGRLGPNGLLWIDRSGLDATHATDGPGAVLVPRAEPRAFSIAWSGPGRAVVRDARGEAFADIERDRFGRPFLRRAGSAPGEPAGGRASRDGPRVTVVGEADRLRDVYPAVLASVGDAADRLGLVPAVRIVAPRSGTDWPDVLAGTDGLVLPGGADMGQVAGQVAAAAVALRRNLPTLGLCLGMQTMTVALARSRLDAPDATLEELDPTAPDPVFVRLRDAAGAPRHRLGSRRLSLEADAPFARRLSLPASWPERMNHRYGVAAGWRDRLAAAPGLRLVVSPDEDTVDLVAFDHHPFFVGSQGHPELGSTSRHPHPLVTAWLQACGSSPQARR